MGIAGKKALVLGGTSGIGLASAIKLKGLGATVFAIGRSEANLQAAADAGLNTRQADVLDRPGLTTLFEALAPFDILICAATGGPRANGPFLKMDLDAFQNSFQKFWGYTNAVRLGAPHLTADGVIVLISGAPATKPRLGSIALTSVGGAVEAFAKGMAAELAPRRINVVSPGIVDTPMFAVSGAARQQFLQQATNKFLLPRPGTPEEIADAVVLAATNPFMTGARIDVDGGWISP
jgi:NAD(P)-dependent dehydrogenase (short-subunit alcohol dehydrogenase family)